MAGAIIITFQGGILISVFGVNRWLKKQIDKIGEI